MWHRISLRKRIYIILTTLVVITSLGGMIMVWYTYSMEGVLASIIEKDFAAFQSAEALEHSLVNQKGFVSYYFMDGDAEWLRRLGEYRQIFRAQLNEVRSLELTDSQKRVFDQIDREYQNYIDGKDRVITQYMNGEREAGLRLHQKVRDHYFKILDLCEEYKNLHKNRILEASKNSRSKAKKIRYIAAIAVAMVFMLAILMAFVMAKQVLDPLRKLIQEADRQNDLKIPDNEVKALSRSVQGLIEDAGQTHMELERSREHLLQAEKMAMVGKLAAGMAHSIRNPLTSVKMRLFSLSRSLELSDYQKEDFEVISEEIRHTDTIVQNFLEFSRPPKLIMQQISPSVVVDLAIQLLEHRLKSYDVNVNIIRKQTLPEIQADPEQLKEVLVNLMVNACEAMEQGGSIVVHEEASTEPSSRVVVIRMIDNGPGIPESIRNKVFEPFFTTKEEGTGLGLSIASRIIEEHGGWLDVQFQENEGTTFIITLPLKESGHEQDSDH